MKNLTEPQAIVLEILPREYKTRREAAQAMPRNEVKTRIIREDGLPVYDNIFYSIIEVEFDKEIKDLFL